MNCSDPLESVSDKALLKQAYRLFADHRSEVAMQMAVIVLLCSRLQEKQQLAAVVTLLSSNIDFKQWATVRSNVSTLI